MGVTASLHKLTAGSGYDYLTRQVAVQDSTEKGHSSLASYYTEKGEVPGRWIGSGMAALEMVEGSAVSEVQMRSLFGAGFHPDMEARLAALPAGASQEQVRAAGRLGSPFKILEAASRFQQEVAIRCSQWAAINGLGSGGGVPVGVRAGIRNDVATEAFAARVGRRPSAVELSSEVARLTRTPTTACAGYDVTFTPVKSVSALWAVAPTAMAAAIEEAHNAAVGDALRFLEERVLFSRRGAGGVRQVEVTGLIGAAFTHRDSRAGDPNLHTHVAIANKVQAFDGAWLAIDGRPLHAGMVSISEVYNTALEAHLGTRLGLRFAPEPQRDPTKRVVREVVGVPAGLREAWSSRRAAIEARQAELAVDFQVSHGRPPTPAEAIALAQQATLETRQAKHEPRSLQEQRATWATQAAAVLGAGGVEEMLHTLTTTPATPAPVVVSAGWVAATADQMVERMGTARASWTVWHLQAEASRRARERATTPEQAELLTAELLAAATARCVAVEGWTDPVSDPGVLRRSDGQSMYSTVGTRRFTSTAVIDAEQQITRAAGLTDGRRVDEVDVSLALLASTARGVTLNAGQVGLVRAMATSGCRVQLGLAAAGSGKTTALAVLAGAWRESGGTVLGLAPSAVAALVLGEQIGASATLAKVAYDLHHHPSNVAGLIGADTLLIVDEAGMADTPTLATVVSYAVGRGASVRLIGDDQQLAAVGAGGVLRDIADLHGAVHLTEILRFEDSAEAAASLALREGRLEALGFYLDQDRIHPGSDETILRDALAGWIADRATGVESVMLAGTRDQVATLNRWARDHRLTSPDNAATAGRMVSLSDGNLGSAGDVIVTRQNNRRLAVSATDWVKNGDRWTITAVEGSGGVRAVHRDTGLHITLPAGYVAEHVELGYAVTVHGAQGITVDTTHTVLSGAESRQQMYVAMSRGRHANHAYVQVVDSDGGENAPIHPATLRPVTPVDVLEQILARDGSSRSVTTEARHAADPYTRLGHAAARYSDALTVAIETLHHDAVAELDEGADRVVDGLTACPAWPTLRAHLLHHAANNESSPLEVLRAAVEVRELATAADPAAVLTWRIPDPAGPGPLPWLPPIPSTVAGDGRWGPYLIARATLVADVAGEVRAGAAGVRPVWALPGQTLTAASVGEVEVWRAACGVERTDRRPTGPVQLGAAAHLWQQKLNDRIRPAHPVGVWMDLLRDIRDDLPRDPYAPVLAHRLAALHQTGVAVTEQLAVAVADGPLPSEQPAAALWWRLARHLTTTTDGSWGVPEWEGRLAERLGYTAAAELESSPWWPHLAAAITHALDEGAVVDDLLTPVTDVSGFDDACQAMLWRTHHHTQPLPDDVGEPPHPDELPPEGIEEIDWSTRRRDLDDAAQLRDRTDPDFTDIELRRGFAAADRWAATPHTPERLAQVTAATTAFFEDHLAGSWSQSHFVERFGTDLAGDPRFRLGHAPTGWTTLISELRKQGFSTDELLAAGVATTTKAGMVVDRFRDRAMVPILHDQVVVGFVGRRHPHADDGQGPKYLNSPASALFAKREVLYGHHLLAPEATPVIVEGPMDAIAVTLAGHGTFVGVAPLGTALTPEQVLLLAGGKAPVLATDADRAGHVAAEHAFWLLAEHRHDPGRVHLPTGTDPAQLLQTHGPQALSDALQTATPQALQMVAERVAFLPPDEAAREIAEITAARPPATWPHTLDSIPEDHTAYLVGRVNAWTTTPTMAGEAAREQTRAMRRRLEQPAEIRWQRWANRIGLDTAAVGEWAALADRLDELHHAGADTHLLGTRLAGAPAGVVVATVAGHTPGQPVAVDWRPWANSVNPDLVTEAEWGGVEEQLSRLQAVGANLDALGRSMAGRSPVQVVAGLRSVLLRHAVTAAGGGVLVSGARHDRSRGGQHEDRSRAR